MTAVAEHRRLRLALDCTLRDVCGRDLPLLEWFGTYAHLRRMEEANFRDVEAGAKLWLVADVNDFPVGHLKVNLRVEDPLRGNPRGYIFALRVFEPFQGLGIGTALIEAAESSLRARGLRYVSIAVGKDNPRAASTNASVTPSTARRSGAGNTSTPRGTCTAWRSQSS